MVARQYNASAYLQYRNDPWLMDKANGIITSQKMEIIVELAHSK